ncbi:WXG100 family type VII secretion target [Nocardia sp. NPDC048505]|uniref:WXG100 family type VII secretion target n=1 Tax=unclassified Nocardia TaxID=2637762 RepID=UPI0033F4C428
MREIQVTTERWPHTRTDPDYVPSVEIFDNITHKQIHDSIQLMDPTVLDAGRQAWQQSATGLADAVTAAHTEIRATIADGWRGGAAQTAAEAVRAFEQQGSRLADVMATVAQRLGQAGDAAETLRSAVGRPSDQQPDLGAALLDPSQATSNVAAQKSTENDRQDVVASMESVYTNAFIQSGVAVPAFPGAAEVGAPVAAAAPSTPGVAIAAPVAETEKPVLQPVSVAPAAARPEAAVPGAETPEPAAEPGATAPASVLSAAGLPGVVLPGDTTPAAATTQPAGLAAPTTPSAAAAPERLAAAPAGAPVAPAPAAPTVPSGFAATSTAAADDERKREERRRDTSGDAVAGAGVGAMGGMLGGALAAGGDSPRGGSGVSARPAPATSDDEDDDDELHWTDDELTFLEPADEPRELIGSMDPTTPPVVGEWTELE